jgi:Glycosyltransferase family 87
MSSTLKTILALALLGSSILYLALRSAALEEGTDFPHFYVAAKMVAEGHGREIYNFAAQEEFQARYVGRIGTYYLHPPFETLLYLPLTYFPLRQAHLIWCLINAAFLVFTAKLTSHYLAKDWDWQILLAVFLLFPPVLLDFLQGQDSILLLFIFIVTLVQLQRGRVFLAGVILACGLFKFHLVLLVALVFAVLKGKKILEGFAIPASVLVLISAAIGGWETFAEYLKLVEQAESQSLSGVHPQAMANLRGLTALVLPNGHVADVIVAVTSLLVAAGVLYIARLRLKQGSQPQTTHLFAIGILASILISYSLSPHDLCVLLLPMTIFWCDLKTGGETSKAGRVAGVSLLAILLLPPLHVILLREHDYAWTAVPTLILFIVMSVQTWRTPLHAQT